VPAKSEKGKGKEIRVVDEVSLAIHLKLGSQSISRSSTSSAEGSPVPLSRASTPAIHERKAHFGQKTLVLDLDETLIHSTSRPNPSLASSGSGFFGLGLIGRGNKSPGHTVEVILGGKHTQYHVYKRPFVDFFLRTVSNPNQLFFPRSALSLGRFLDGILWSSSLRLCKSTQILSSIG
jgi:CTD nuclear envelope phosphatase 1